MTRHISFSLPEGVELITLADLPPFWRRGDERYRICIAQEFKVLGRTERILANGRGASPAEALDRARQELLLAAEAAPKRIEAMQAIIARTYRAVPAEYLALSPSILDDLEI